MGGYAFSFFGDDKRKLDPAPGLAVGKRIGDFRLIALIGQGGMGQVWEAEQASLGRRVAVKFVRPERVTERGLELFAREARAGGRLSHPGIVTIHGYGKSEGLVWIAMEFVRGAWTLRDFLDEALGLPEVPEGYDRQVARLVAEIADAMQAAHEAGVIHRDLKPQNVLLTPDDRPKVMDFGLARIIDETAISETGDFAGTYLYMSPEQVTAKRMGLDHRTDVFSLGVVLYELLTFRRPFQGDTTHQIAEQIVTLDPPDPRVIRSRVPRDLAVIVGKTLEKARDRRYATMRAFAEDLRRFLHDELILATPPTRVDRLRKWAARNPGKSSAVAIAVSATLVIGWLGIANVRANRRLTRSNQALEAKSLESEQRREVAEDLAEREHHERERADRAAQDARRRADDVLRLSAARELEELVAEADRLWPVHPGLVGDYELWLQRARRLVEGLDPSRDGVDRGHRARLEELRARALPAPADAGKTARPTPELVRLESQIASLERAEAVRAGRFPAEEPEIEASSSADAKTLAREARSLVHPQRTTFGSEPRGLALARLGYERAGDVELTSAALTFAWALHANGMDGEALEIARAGVEGSTEEEREGWRAELDDLERRVATRSDAQLLAHLRARADSVRATERAWRFDLPEDGWWHAQLERLVAGIGLFADPERGRLGFGRSSVHGWGIELRLWWARELAPRTVGSPAAAARWTEALSSIADPEQCPAYGGLALEPQLGLIPIGRDPRSGLWEFADPRTGVPPTRGTDGRLRIGEESALVFVLVPGGAFWMGAQVAYADGPSYEPAAVPDESPVHEVHVDPLFVSKYELTQGQWLRLTGANPSTYDPATAVVGGRRADLRHPVEGVSWEECTRTLAWLGFALPSESQWEYAARAGSTSAWWCGSETSTLLGAANVADQEYARNAASGLQHESFDDGHAMHAPVGSFSANPFGLHDVHGNVAEWCASTYASYASDGEEHPRYRVLRGGGFTAPAPQTRSALRTFFAPDAKQFWLGVRPVRSVEGR